GPNAVQARDAGPPPRSDPQHPDDQRPADRGPEGAAGPSPGDGNPGHAVEPQPRPERDGSLADHGPLPAPLLVRLGLAVPAGQGAGLEDAEGRADPVAARHAARRRRLRGRGPRGDATGRRRGYSPRLQLGARLLREHDLSRRRLAPPEFLPDRGRRGEGAGGCEGGRVALEPGIDSEALDFRAASESFAAVRKLTRLDLRHP